MKCKDKKLTFICPSQYLCVSDICLVCNNPSCVTKEDTEITNQMLQDRNKTELANIDDMYVSAFPVIESFGEISITAGRKMPRPPRTPALRSPPPPPRRTTTGASCPAPPMKTK